MNILTRRSVLAVALLVATPTLAQQQPNRPAAPADPVAALRAFYAKPENAPVERHMSAKLRRLYQAQMRRSATAEGPLPGLDFAFACGCQDSDDNYHTRNVYRVVSQDERRAKVAVTVKVFASETATQTITFDLARENGRWLIDDVAGTGDPGWVLSQLLQMRE